MSGRDSPQLPDPWARFPRFEYEQHAPKQFQLRKQIRLPIVVLWVCGTVLIGYGIFSGLHHSDSSLFIGIFVWMIFSLVCSLPNLLLGYEANEAVARAQFDHQQNLQKMMTQVSHDVAHLTKRGRLMMGSANVENSPGAQVRISINHSFNREPTPAAEQVFSQIDKQDSSLADAVAAITAFLEQQPSKEAWQSWMDFLEESGKQKDRKPSLLRACWDSVVKYAPKVLELAESVSKVVRIFAG